MKQDFSAGDHAPHTATVEPETAAKLPDRSDASPRTKSAGAVPRQSGRIVRVTSPASLLAIVPSLLGFQPRNSMVLIGTVPPRAQVSLTLRYDLPDPPDAGLAMKIAGHATAVLGQQSIGTAMAVGYGPDHLVTPVAEALAERARQTGLRMTEVLRVEDQRYWSYLCDDPCCCLPEGTPFDGKDHPAAIAMAADGGQVLASRSELAATVAASEGETAELMHIATRRAAEHATRLIGRVARSGRKGAARRLIAAAGLDAVAESIACYRRGDRIPPGDGAAWLTVVLRDLRVRDDAWSRMLPPYRDAHLRLWTDLTRLARPGYVAAPASLLAFVAWQSGNGALANVALDRALNDDPYYSMAMLLRQAIDSGAPPSMARLPMTPEEVAASYDDLEDDDLAEDGLVHPGDDFDGEDEEDLADFARTAEDGPAHLDERLKQDI